MSMGYVADIKKAAKDNEFFRNVLVTGAKSQLVIMSLRPGEEIGMEVHDGDQIIYVVDGEGRHETAPVDRTRACQSGC